MCAKAWWAFITFIVHVISIIIIIIITAAPPRVIRQQTLEGGDACLWEPHHLGRGCAYSTWGDSRPHTGSGGKEGTDCTSRSGADKVLRGSRAGWEMILKLPVQTATSPSTSSALTHTLTQYPKHTRSHTVNRIHDAASAKRLFMECFLNYSKSSHRRSDPA